MLKNRTGTLTEIERRLDQITIGLTTSVFDVTVTRWGIDRFELWSIDGRKIITLCEAMDYIKEYTN